MNKKAVAKELVKIAKSLSAVMTPAEWNELQLKYRNTARQVEYRIAMLSKEVGKHRLFQERDTKNWGYLGDMGHVAEGLTELIDFLKSSNAN